MPVKIVVDSSSDLPKQLASQLGIITVPMPVYIDGTTFYEGLDIFPDTFYVKFKSYKELPKTSQPNPNDLQKVYEKILADGYDVIAIHLSSGLSSTYQTALMVKEVCTYPDRIHIIDSLGASLGFGLLAISAHEIAQRLDNTVEIVEEIIKIRDRMRYIFTIDTLEYLVKGGRVSKTAGFVAGLLDVKPILHINREGKIEVFNKVRSRKAALRKLVDIVEQNIKDPTSQIIGISHAASLEEANMLATEMQKRLGVKEVILSEIGCVIGSHVGPGTIAVFYQQ
ncbi:MAG: DegV family protein [Peptococcaceae bacterium]|nr:DegV family protein [Peptococcaceae bacterium]